MMVLEVSAGTETQKNKTYMGTLHMLVVEYYSKEIFLFHIDFV